MATEILINDGGAPARILPFTAASAVTVCTSGAAAIALKPIVTV